MMMDDSTGELTERRLDHQNGEADTFYRSSPKPVRVGIEATGPMHWFERLLITSSGAKCYDADFYPFGGERDITNTCPQNYKFTGKERDTETGNDYFGARYYASNFGRFLSPDWSAIPAPVPYANLTNPQTLNLYAIVRDNPETFADLDGHCNQDWTTPCKNNGTSVKGKVAAKGDGSVKPNPDPGDGTKASPTQQGQQQTLTNAQDAAMNNPNYKPGAGGATHCNQATCSVAKAMGAPMAPIINAHGIPLEADQIRANLAKSGSGYHQVSADQAQLLANQGKLVVVAGPGHVATVRPDTGQKLPGRGPLIANIGRTNGVIRLSYVFRKSALPYVKFYTPNQ